jgi:hypothetical protein
VGLVELSAGVWMRVESFVGVWDEGLAGMLAVEWVEMSVRVWD